MEEQISIMVSIITALLTGGVIILFLENQHVGNNVIERFQFIMKPFMHRLSNYFKFLSSAETFFSIERGVKTDEATYAISLQKLMNGLGHYAHPCIMSGQDYPASQFSARELDGICEDINNVWYYWDNKRNYIKPYIEYDLNKANMFCELGHEYLNEVFPNEYNDKSFSMNLIGDVSGKFYTNVYQPIQNVPYDYEYWCNQEKTFKTITLSNLGFYLFTLIAILFFRYLVPIWILDVFTMIGIILLGFSIYRFTKLESLARSLFR